MTSDSRSFLAIRFARLGDVILLLPALSELKAAFPQSRLTLVTGHRCAPIAKMCPAIDEVVSVDRLAMRDGPILQAIADMARLVGDLRGRRFDCVIDFHSFRETNLLAWLSGAPLRVGLKRHNRAYLPFCFNVSPVHEDKEIHVAEMFIRVVKSLPGVDALRRETAYPYLKLPGPVHDWLSSMPEPCKPRLSLFVGAGAPDRVWPPERFAEIADFAIGQLGAEVRLLAAHGDRRLAERALRSVRARDRLKVYTNLSLPQLAGVISTSRLFISNDTGPMHLGPALGVPTLGLFSVGYPEHYGPFGRLGSYLRHQPIEDLAVERVMEELVKLWAKTTTVDRDPRR